MIKSAIEKVLKSFQHRPQIINVYRKDRHNTGDLHSTPILYFDFPVKVKHNEIYKTRIRPKRLKDNVVIVGGGGTLGNHYFASNMKTIAESKALKRIAWGIGHNLHGSDKIQFPDYLQKFDLVGIRDYEFGYDWVPCASCLHPLFDKEYPIQHEIVVYEHYSFSRLPIRGYPKLNNRTYDLEKILKFLGSGNIILTSTYHGAYWGIILNRKVIIVNPFSSKFYGMKHQPPIATDRNWNDKIKDAKNHPEALHECRTANKKFADKIFDIFNY
jgi:hypothetical protein